MASEVEPTRISQTTNRLDRRTRRRRTPRSIWWYESEFRGTFDDVAETTVHLNIDGMTVEEAVEVLLTCAEDVRREQRGELRVAVMLEPDDVALIEAALIEARQSVTLPSPTLDRISRARQRCYERGIR